MSGGYYNVECDKCAEVVRNDFTRMDGAFKNLRVCYTCYEPFPGALTPKKVPKGEMRPAAHASPRQLDTMVRSTGDLVWERAFFDWDNEYNTTNWEEL